MTAPDSYQYNEGDERLDWRRTPGLMSDLPFRRVVVRLYQYLTIEQDYKPRIARWIIEQSEQVIRDGMAADLKPRELLVAIHDFMLDKMPTPVVSRLTIGWRVADGSPPPQP